VGIFYYAMDDKKKDAYFNIPLHRAQELNEKGYGIHRTIQEYSSCERKLENIQDIIYFAIDIDANKEERQDIISFKKKVLSNLGESKLEPSLIIETRNGYHSYWSIKGDVPGDSIVDKGIYYKTFMKERLRPLFGSDPQGIGLNRTLRSPGFYHHKQEPFMVRKIYSADNKYSVLDMQEAFEVLEPTKIYIREKRVPNKEFDGKGIEYIKDTISIVDLANNLDIPLICMGEKFKARCPSGQHKDGDKNPSLVIYPHTNSFYCFSCGCGGDVIDLVRLKLQGTNAQAFGWLKERL
jgi:hypothetical protein